MIQKFNKSEVFKHADYWANASMHFVYSLACRLIRTALFIKEKKKKIKLVIAVSKS